jgi:NhaP-type Na+/H+ or K+/H+ antiporter
MADFSIVFIGSLIIGFISALLVAFFMKRQASYKYETLVVEPDLNERQLDAMLDKSLMMEVAMMLLCPYISYLMAEGLELSGICAILINGIFLSYYAAPNLSEEARRLLHMTYETIAFGCETMVFLFLGIGMFAFDQAYSSVTITFVVLTIVNLFIARAINIVGVSALVNSFRSKDSKIRWNF